MIVSMMITLIHYPFYSVSKASEQDRSVWFKEVTFVVYNIVD